MNLSDRLTRTPRPFDPDRGAEVLEALPGLPPELRELVAGAAGCSPYLHGLIRREAAWLVEAVEAPEAALEAVLNGVPEVAPEALSAGLRQAKRRLALMVALADLGGVWALEEVTGWLTRLADAACEAALAAEVARAVRRGKLPASAAERRGGGLTLFAMGKMGAGELNYSSDIDLIALFDETALPEADFDEARAGLVRITRAAAKMLGEMTAEGYVFRTDLRLRPDASVMPVALSMGAAEQYYESVGRSWERAAWIKARPAAGDREAGERFIETLRPFIWRRHLDFAAIEDAHDIRQRIRDHKGLGGPLTLEEHDVKLGQGGIREIEFYVQTRQLIAGGRDPSLRVRGTVEGLGRLVAAGWIPQETAERLAAHYRAHREVEHRLQMLHDTQTHALPGSAEGFARLAAFMGREVGELRAELEARCREVSELTEGFFAPGATPPPPPLPDYAREIVARWPSYPALRSPRAGQIFRRLQPELLAALAGAAHPQEALGSFDAFLNGLPAGVQLFSLFDSNPELTHLIADIAGTAPALSRYLSANAGVLDAVIGGSFFAPWPGAAGLTELFSATLARGADYETVLDRARVLAKEWHFRVGVHHLRGLVTAEEAGAQYADIAEASLSALWPHVVAEFAAKHGSPPGRGAMALGMGSLGAGRLNAGSDLDLIVIYDAAGVEESEGRRPLPARTFYARLAQALVTAMTAPTAEGKLYEIDMRLRPSGRQGPVATALSAYKAYQAEEAWVWEHLALTRARAVAGEAELGAEIEAFREALLGRQADSAGIAREVAEMRARIAAARGAGALWDAKTGPGRLLDIELAAQMLGLMAGSAERTTAGQLEAGQAAGLIEPGEAEVLESAHRLFWRLQATGRLLTGGRPEPEELGEGGRRMLLRETAEDAMEDLEATMRARGAAAAEIIDALIARAGQT
ncbi:glutamine-synthetase adenylyltransferase [Pseudoroseicyclus tamaricis]|uniref:Glutamine-synthetase adenylyltransferase n=1 Tax=Pseudoroseicyclus tamaricis TaxID=2705421 RepID=A0A6B2JHS1_9RHOB|nr:glutamine-synthetase adenylyltransferase [Pseudoroseicyclus tamaricis]NDV00871.1 glutamine-synthetase adenylyltransferase [Pseudoroseicyclus tamaricis]